METSPLTKAHDHARAASHATRSADSTVAINEHALAAGEFSNAAKATSSIEALRTLRLLEQHHKKLSELLRFPLEQTSQQSTDENDTVVDGEERQPPTVDNVATTQNQAGPDSVTSSPLPTAPKPMPALPHRRRYPGRDLSSSIASNLATARGIKSRMRGQPLTPSVSNDQAPGSLEVHPRRGNLKQKNSNMLDQTGKPSWVPPAQTQAPKPPEQPPPNNPKSEAGSSNLNEEGFSRFYSTFGSIINRLSAPLAFAGLPLIAEESSSEAAPATVTEQSARGRSRSKSSQTANVEPDLSKIYSKATLRALRGDGNTTNDSFYVVPTSGHTVSYASILSFDQKEKRRLAASIHGEDTGVPDDPDEEDFVDARESQASMSPGLRRRLGKNQSQTDKNAHNVIEELYLENASLKEMLDKLSKRLHAFEINSQSSHLALAQSLRLQRPSSPMSSSGGGGGGSGAKIEGVDEAALKKRNRELEEQLAAAAKQMDMLEKEYNKLEQTLDKYRDRWEKLKAGAKARREAQGSAEVGESLKNAK